MVEGALANTEILLWGVAVYAVATLVALVVGLRVLLALPPTYLAIDDMRSGARRPTWRTTVARVARNAGGFILIAVGALLSLPGIPGQGLLTILVGVMLLDFPGRRRIERRILGRRTVLAHINRLRARFGRPPIIAPPPGTNGDA